MSSSTTSTTVGGPPPGAWNSHVHCFDPEKHPFKDTRAYTPQAASLDSLCDNVLTNKVMVVQASIEDGPGGLLSCLALAREKHSDRVFRGTIFADPEPGRGLENIGEAEFDRYHEAGVRSIRIHGSYGGSGTDLDWVRGEFCSAARLYPVRRYGWSISAQLPLRIWSLMAETLRQDPDLAGVPILADHNGCASPDDVGSPELEAFLELLGDSRVYVKIGALHRRAPNDFRLMQPVVQRFAQRNPRSILWGSDWPHVNGSRRGLLPGPSLQGIDDTAEFEALRTWLSDEQWHAMLVSNPARIFET